MTGIVNAPNSSNLNRGRDDSAMNDDDCLALQHSLTNALAQLHGTATLRADETVSIASIRAALSELADEHPDYAVVTAGMVAAYRDLESMHMARNVRAALESQAKMMFGIQLRTPPTQ